MAKKKAAKKKAKGAKKKVWRQGGPDWAKLAKKKEDLHLDLAGHVHSTVHGTLISHPLYHGLSLPNAIVNFTYTHRKKAADEARKEKDWQKYVFVHERPYVLKILLDVAKEMDDKSYWEMASLAWADVDNLHQYKRQIKKLLLAKRPGREHMMDDKERKALAKLPAKIEIYRGYSLVIHKDGWAWTTDKTKAQWFAERFAEIEGKPMVSVGICKKSDVLAHLLGRGESEIVIDPELVKVKKVLNFKKPKRD